MSKRRISLPPPDPKDDGDLRYVPLEDEAAPIRPREVTDDGAGSEPLPSAVSLQGPIRAGKGRVRGAKAWWAEAWAALIDTESLEGTVGRRLARKGAALSVEIGLGHVQARVAATKTFIVRAAFSVETFSNEEWAAILTALSANASFAAALLNGDLPYSVEHIVNGVGHAFIPPMPRFECSCPEGWATPCSHAAALHYVIADRLESDPLLLFQLRGLPRDQIIPLLIGVHP